MGREAAPQGRDGGSVVTAEWTSDKQEGRVAAWCWRSPDDWTGQSWNSHTSSLKSSSLQHFWCISRRRLEETATWRLLKASEEEQVGSKTLAVPSIAPSGDSTASHYKPPVTLPLIFGWGRSLVSILAVLPPTSGGVSGLWGRG